MYPSVFVSKTLSPTEKYYARIEEAIIPTSSPKLLLDGLLSSQLGHFWRADIYFKDFFLILCMTSIPHQISALTLCPLRLFFMRVFITKYYHYLWQYNLFRLISNHFKPTKSSWQSAHLKHKHILTLQAHTGESDLSI